MSSTPNIFQQLAAQPGGQGEQSTAAPAPTATAPQPQPSGNVFEQLAANGGNPPQSSAPQQPQANDGFLSGLYQNTLGPLVSLGKELSDYQAKKTLARQAVDAVGGTLPMLIDAVSDPQHPLHKLGAGLVQAALDQAKQAYDYSGDATTAEKMAWSALMKGNWNEAKAEGATAQEAGSKAIGHSIATVLPGVGPAAASAGEDLAAGNIAHGLGAATGLVAGVLAPGAAAKGLGAAGDAIDAVKALPGKMDAVAPAETLRSTLRDSAKIVGDEHGIEVPDSQSVHDSFSDASEGLYSKSKGLYKQIDDATGDKWAMNERALKAVSRGLRTATDEETLAESFGRQQELLEQQDAILKEAEANGVDPDTIAQAKSTWRQASALDDLQGQVSISTEGRAGITDGEFVQPKKLLPRLIKMYNANRLQEALGSEANAAEMIRQVESAGDSIQAAEKLTKTLKATGLWALKGLVYGGPAVYGAKLLGSLGGEHER
jgi:hypothetical protein